MLEAANSLLPRKVRFSALSRTRNRARLHAAILLAGAGIILTMSIGWETFYDAPLADDKAKHYEFGRGITAGTFYLAYICIILRVLLVGRGHGSLTRILLWVPAMTIGGVLLALLAVFTLSFAKEAVDLGGVGDVEWLDVDAAVEGAMTVVLPIALIMALTPLLIPLDILLQMPRLRLSRVRTGIQSLDGYLRAQEIHKQTEKPADVMLVEDDIVCATTVLNFCRSMGLKCHHVSTIAEAGAYLQQNMAHLRLLVLDNFLRVDNGNDNTTGSQWLSVISHKFPVSTRPFRVVIISGYTELLGEAGGLADLVLKKPWSHEPLEEFLARSGIIPDSAGNDRQRPVLRASRMLGSRRHRHHRLFHGHSSHRRRHAGCRRSRFPLL